jgi:hypothetical protein
MRSENLSLQRIPLVKPDRARARILHTLASIFMSMDNSLLELEYVDQVRHGSWTENKSVVTFCPPQIMAWSSMKRRYNGIVMASALSSQFSSFPR